MSNSKEKSTVKRGTQTPISDKSVSKKDVAKALGFGEVPSDYNPKRDGLFIPDNIKGALKEMGLVPRWINAKQYKKQGYHNSDWRPLSAKILKDYAGANLQDVPVNADGYIQRNDVVLAVKTEEWNQAHKDFLRKKANAKSSVAKRNAEELRQHMQSSGHIGQVFEGYEDNE